MALAGLRGSRRWRVRRRVDVATTPAHPPRCSAHGAAARRDGQRWSDGLACDGLCGGGAAGGARRPRRAGFGRGGRDAPTRRRCGALHIGGRVGAMGRFLVGGLTTARAAAHCAGLVCGGNRPLGPCIRERHRGQPIFGARSLACRRPLATGRPPEGAARPTESTRLRPRTASLGAGRAGDRLCSRRPARSAPRAHRDDVAPSDRARA